MNIKLHNTYQVTIHGKTYTAYNTLLKGVYDKIKNLEQFTSHIAIGTGTQQKSFNDSKLGTYLRTFPTQTEEISSSIENETLFIKKTVLLDESDVSTFSFSELGLTDTETFDPDIYNHVVLTDEQGKVVSITRNAGEVLQITVTIYLTLNNISDAQFTLGNNVLIQQILGENLQLDDNTLYAIRGEDLSSNETPIYRAIPEDTSKMFACTPSIIFNDDQTIDISFDCELGEGATEELLLIYGNQVAMRLNTLSILTPTQNTQTLTPSLGNTTELGKYIQSVDIVNQITSTENISVTDYSVTKYGNIINEKISNIFDINFPANTQKFVAKDGSTIAFLYDNSIHLYKLNNSVFTKVNTTLVPTQNILNIILFDKVIVVVLKVSPYIRIFEIEDNIATERDVSLESYYLSAFSYDWEKVDGVRISDNKIMLGFILNNENKTPLILTLTRSATRNAYFDVLTRPTIDKALNMYTINKTPYNDAVIAFVTDEFNNQLIYTIEEFSINGSQYGPSSEDAFKMISNVQSLISGGRTLIAQRSVSPYAYVFYYPDLTLAPESISSGIQHFISHDGNYMAVKDSSGNFAIYNANRMNELIKFEKDIPSSVDQTTIVDIVFMQNLILVFTSSLNNPIFALKIKENLTRIDNLPDESSNYEITSTNYNIMGSRDLEGVKLSLNFKFGSQSSTTETVNLDGDETIDVI